MNVELSALYPIALVLLGVLASVTRLVKSDVFDKFPQFLFAVCYPCIILQVISRNDFFKMITENTYSTLFMTTFTLAAMIFGLIVAKWVKEDGKKPVVKFAMMGNNTTFIGLPVAMFIFGERGVVFVLFCSVVQDLFTWTAGYRFYSKQKNSSPFSALINPIMISFVSALILSLAGTPEIPIFDDVVEAFGAMTMPIALFYMGHVFVEYKAAIFRIRWRVLVLSAVKVIAFPAITALVLLPLPIDPFFKNVSIFVSGLPVALLTVMFSKQFDKDSGFAVELILSSTAMYLLVISILVHFQVFAL